jgi:RIO kinase 1
MSDKRIDTIDQKLDKQRIKEKDIDMLKVIESVFDNQTSMIVFKLINKGVLKEISFVVSTGKEANVYHAFGPDNEELAVKIYRTTTAEFKRNWMYVEGDPRFKSYKKGTYSFIYTWARKEYKNLQRMQKAKIRIPSPIAISKNVLVMKFIGEKQNAAPLLKDANLKKPNKIYAKVVDFLFKLYDDANLVHADLSEYNILFYKKEPIIIDVSQAVLLDHPYAPVFLYRDISNINRYFTSLGVQTLSNDELYEQITETPPSQKIKSMEI